MKKARYFKKLDGGKVECTACDWHCKIEPGELGVCGVRQNKGGELYSLVYGKAVDAYGDWIEKKKLAHFIPGSMAFSIGTIACNFSCGFCLNWETSQMSKIVKTKLRSEGRTSELGTTISDLGYDMPPEKVVEYCKKKRFPAIAFTYNEPTVFLEYALDTARLARKEGIKSVFVTNAYMSEESIPDLAGSMDAFSIDLKAYSDKFYRKICKAGLEPVLRNIRDLFDRGCWIEITTLIIPGENDSEKELKKIADFISGMSNDIPWHVTKFHPDYQMMDKSETPDETIYKAYDIGKERGLKYIYFGNLWVTEKTSTFCPNCGELLIHRDVYDVKLKEVFKDGKCGKCGELIAGVWK